jgi:hypothetical protein
MDPGRPGTGLSSIPFNPSDVGKYNSNSSVFTAGPVTDYAANDMVFGSAMNTIYVPANNPPYTYDPNWSHSLGNLHMFNRTIQQISDGSSNTILLGIKAMATQVYNKRGPGSFTISNGTTDSTYDDAIAQAGPGVLGLVRGISPDTTWYAAGPLNTSTPDVTYVPGETFGITSSWQSWFQFTFRVVQDARDLNAYNCWGGPYSGGGLFTMGDGSVRSISYSVSDSTVIDIMTPNGGEVPPSF